MDHPDRFLKVLATVAKSLKYNVVVQADYVKEVSIRNKHLLYRPDIKSRYPQSLLDKLICHGYTDQIFIIFHLQCDIFLNLLSPLFCKTPRDIEIIRRACSKAALRYQAYEHEYIQNGHYPKKRMLMLSKEQENHMRIGFWRDLLQDKFLMYYEAAAMRNSIDLLDRDYFGSELRGYLFKLSFVINKSVIKALEVDFWSILVRNVESRSLILKF
jgi:hypothetical protein